MADLKIFCEGIDGSALEQIYSLAKFEAYKDSKIRIMPDAHAGIGCTIGTTMTLTDRVTPNLVGVDIGCGMIVAELGRTFVDPFRLEEIIERKIPSGMNIRSREVEETSEALAILDALRCPSGRRDYNALSVGTLGGGNHFIELGEDDGGNVYLVIHSGSRNLGKQVAEFYQKLAIKLEKGYGSYLADRDEIIRTYKEQGRASEIQAALKELRWEAFKGETPMPDDLCYLYGEYLEDYLHDVEICQAFAKRNRELMAEILCERAGLTAGESFHTIHNYIDTDEMILRKGSIAAHKGEKVLIPINMRDGSVIAIGKGNPEWNYSAPHGAGRLMSRTKAKDTLSMEDYKKAMEGIFTTSVNEDTLDEAPMAYKSLEDIIDVITESVDVVEVIKPVYNFKA